MIRIIRLTLIVISAPFFSGCNSHTFLFPVHHEMQKLAIVELTLDTFLEKEVQIFEQFDVNSRNVFFIEQLVPWWKQGRPSRALLNRLAEKYADHFIIRRVRHVEWEELTNGNKVIDRSPIDPGSGKTGEIISIQKIKWIEKGKAAVHFRVWAGELVSVNYRCILKKSSGQWVVSKMFIKGR